uniref:non-specific serine/threonine protein kinase n=1 Tax=Anopheles culicifacies TaxID=139723 RepID=A0A182MW15_9DIPT
MQQLPQGFSHVGGRLSISEELLLKLKTPRDINEVYQVADTWIAKGMYGIVRGAVSKQSGISYAAKFLRRRRRGQCCLSEINHEIAVLMLCADSDYVVKLHAVHETRSEIALILELATGGELQTLIDEQGQLTEQTTRFCMREILRALQHMHSKSIAHLDLKPQNILLAGKTVDDGLKLCDFGIARFIAEKNKIYEINGTPDYVAPEVLHFDPLSLQTDIWSIGVVAYVLLTGTSPFTGDTKQETFLNVTKCSLTFPDDLFSGISSDAIDFIKCALRIKPKDRLTVDECLEHRWLKEDTVCLREEMLAVRASAAHNKPDTRAVMKDNGIENESNEAVVENGNNSYGIEPVRLHDANTKQKVLTVVECGSINTATTNATSIPSPDEDWYEAGVEDAGGGGGGGGGRKTTSPAELKHTQGSQHDITTAGEENKENVIVVGGLVTRSLFPDAPTTPKVSRKTLPVEPLNDGGHHYPHNHHHHHHHHNHHNHNHNHQHHLHHNSFAAQHQQQQQHHHVLNHSHQVHHLNQVGMAPAPTTMAVSNGGGGNTSLPTGAFASRQGSPSCVKKFVQKMHIHSPVMQRAAESGAEMLMATVPTKAGEEEQEEELYGNAVSSPMLTPSQLPECVVNDSGSMNNTANIADETRVTISCTNETTTTTATTSTPFTAAVTSTVGNSCRATVVAAATLCTLKRTEPTVGCTDHGKQLQPSDKDAITC